MLRTIYSWMSGRGRAVVVVVVALTVLTSGTAMAITYTKSTRPALKLNKASYVGTALTKLASNAVGPALTLETDSTDPAATPLKLDTETGSQAPMSVDSSTRVDNLNADMLDGNSAEQFAPSTHDHDGAYVNEADHTKATHDALNIDAETLDGMDSGEFAPKAVEQWHQVGATNEPGFHHGWRNDGSFDSSTAAFYKDPWGVVHLKGLVKGGTVGLAIFELPCGYGTSERQIHTAFSVNDVARVDIVPALECGNGRRSGIVVPVTGSNTWLTLDGITFRAAGS